MALESKRHWLRLSIRRADWVKFAVTPWTKQMWRAACPVTARLALRAAQRAQAVHQWGECRCLDAIATRVEAIATRSKKLLGAGDRY